MPPATHDTHPGFELLATPADPLRPYALLAEVVALAVPPAVLRAERATLALALPALRADLGPQERAVCEQRSALESATLPNVTVLENPVAAAFERALARSTPVRVVVPALAYAECASLAVLCDRGVSVRFPDFTPGGEPVDVLGHVLAARLERPGAPGDAPLELAPPGARPEVSREDVLRAFGAYAWDAALLAARAHLSAGREDATVSLLGGLGAHYLAPYDPRVAAVAARFFRDACAPTAPPAVHAHALYRLAVHAARHDRDPVRAAALAEESLALALGAVGPEHGRGYYAAWAHNARALAAFRAGDAARAVAAVDAGIALLDTLDPGFEARAAEMVAHSRVHLRVNRGRAAEAQGR